MGVRQFAWSMLFFLIASTVALAGEYEQNKTAPKVELIRLICKGKTYIRRDHKERVHEESVSETTIYTVSRNLAVSDLWVIDDGHQAVSTDERSGMVVIVNDLIISYDRRSGWGMKGGKGRMMERMEINRFSGDWWKIISSEIGYYEETETIGTCEVARKKF